MKFNTAKQKYWVPLVTKQEDVFTYNDAKQNCIFFSPNWENAKFWGKRDKDRVSNVFCLVVDRDDWVKFWEWYEHKPSIIVQTARGYHCYWLLKEPMTNSKQWYETGKWLAHFFWGDAVFDSSRIFRLPWSVYWKDDLWIITTEILEYNDLRYTLEDFSGQIIKQNEIKHINEAMRNNSWYSSVVDEIDSYCNVADVLEKVSWLKRKIDWTAILEDWKHTKWYKYWKHVNWISNFSKHDDYRPQGWPFAVVKQYLGNASAAFKWFQENYWIGNIVKVSDTVQYTNKQEVNWELLFEEISIDWSLVKVDYENATTITYIEDRKTWTQKEVKLMTAAVKPIGYFIKWWINYYIIYYKKQNAEGYFKISEMWRAWMLEKEFSKVWITVYAMKKNVKILTEYFQNTDIQMEYIDKLWVYKDYIIDKAGNYIINVDWKDHYVDLWNCWYEWELIKYSQDIDSFDLSLVIDWFASMYERSISLTAFTWFGMSILSKYVREQIGSFPILNFVWLTQSGKTTVRHAMMNAFWLDKQIETQAWTTEFAMMFNCVHYLPVNVSEFEGKDSMRINWDMFIKNNYDWSKNMRGTAWQEIIFYENNAPICIDWEIKSMNNAVYSRCITLFMNPKNKWKLFRFDWSVAKYFIERKGLMDWFKKEYYKWREHIAEIFKELNRPEKERILDNYAMLYAFAKIFSLWEVVEDAIIKQAWWQFDMMSEDNIDKTIKLVLGTAIQHNLFVTIDEGERTLNIEFYVDVLKVNSNKVDEIKSQIQIVNHHFHWGKANSSHSWDILKIPLQHIFDNKNLHILFNKTLQYMLRNIKPIDSITIASSIIMYAEANWYWEQPFTEDIRSKFSLAKKRNANPYPSDL